MTEARGRDVLGAVVVNLYMIGQARFKLYDCIASTVFVMRLSPQYSYLGVSAECDAPVPADHGTMMSFRKF